MAQWDHLRIEERYNTLADATARAHQVWTLINNYRALGFQVEVHYEPNVFLVRGEAGAMVRAHMAVDLSEGALLRAGLKQAMMIGDARP